MKLSDHNKEITYKEFQNALDALWDLSRNHWDNLNEKERYEIDHNLNILYKKLMAEGGY